MMRVAAITVCVVVAAILSPASALVSFGTGLSSNQLYTYETPIFNHTLSSGARWGTVTHWWAVSGPAIGIDTSIWRYYIDGETTPSIQYVAHMYSGLAFNEPSAPWGNAMIGKGANDGGWFSNLRIPFYKSIRVTAQIDVTQVPNGTTQVTFWAQVRGVEDITTVIAGYTVPYGARLVQKTYNNYVAQPLEYIPLWSVPTGSGFYFMNIIGYVSGNLNFLEGCHRLFTPYASNATSWPGIIVSTGTEDYFDSAYYFDGGMFRFDVSGCTHKTGNEIGTYRIHLHDPLFFENGAQFVWRNGDVTDDQGRKCLTQTGGHVVGSPTPTTLTSYAFGYVWADSNTPTQLA